MSDPKKPQSQNIRLNMPPSSTILPLAEEKFLSLQKVAPQVAVSLYENGDIPEEVFALVVNTRGYNVQDLFRFGQRIRPEIWRIIAPGAVYIWDESLVPTKLTVNKTPATAISPGAQPNITLTTADTTQHVVPLYAFAQDGTWVIRGTIKGHTATDSFGNNFSFIVRVMGGVVEVGPVNNEALDGAATPFPAGLAVDVTVTSPSANLAVTAANSDATTWTIIYGVY